MKRGDKTRTSRRWRRTAGRGSLAPGLPARPGAAVGPCPEPAGVAVTWWASDPFAGRMAYADGAMTSGIREANRLLGRPSVHLGPIFTART